MFHCPASLTCYGITDDRVYGLMELFNMCEHFLLAELDPTSALNRLVIPMASPTGDVGDISKGNMPKVVLKAR